MPLQREFGLERSLTLVDVTLEDWNLLHLGVSTSLFVATSLVFGGDDWRPDNWLLEGTLLDSHLQSHLDVISKGLVYKGLYLAQKAEFALLRQDGWTLNAVTNFTCVAWVSCDVCGVCLWSLSIGLGHRDRLTSMHSTELVGSYMFLLLHAVAAYSVKLAIVFHCVSGSECNWCLLLCELRSWFLDW